MSKYVLNICQHNYFKNKKIFVKEEKTVGYFNIIRVFFTRLWLLLGRGRSVLYLTPNSTFTLHCSLCFAYLWILKHYFQKRQGPLSKCKLLRVNSLWEQCQLCTRCTLDGNLSLQSPYYSFSAYLPFELKYEEKGCEYLKLVQ